MIEINSVSVLALSFSRGLKCFLIWIPVCMIAIHSIHAYMTENKILTVLSSFLFACNCFQTSNALGLDLKAFGAMHDRPDRPR